MNLPLIDTSFILFLGDFGEHSDDNLIIHFLAAKSKNLFSTFR
jgi:hypothetical protein